MNKKVSKIIIALILFVLGMAIPFKNEWINSAIFVIAYIIVGLEVVKEAVHNVFHGKVLDAFSEPEK